MKDKDIKQAILNRLGIYHLFFSIKENRDDFIKEIMDIIKMDREDIFNLFKGSCSANLIHILPPEETMICGYHCDGCVYEDCLKIKKLKD
jgi:hypothetical protein